MIGKSREGNRGWKGGPGYWDGAIVPVLQRRTNNREDRKTNPLLHFWYFHGPLLVGLMKHRLGWRGVVGGSPEWSSG